MYYEPHDVYDFVKALEEKASKIPRDFKRDAEDRAKAKIEYLATKVDCSVDNVYELVIKNEDGERDASFLKALLTYFPLQKAQTPDEIRGRYLDSLRDELEKPASHDDLDRTNKLKIVKDLRERPETDYKDKSDRLFLVDVKRAKMKRLGEEWEKIKNQIDEKNDEIIDAESERVTSMMRAKVGTTAKVGEDYDTKIEQLKEKKEDIEKTRDEFGKTIENFYEFWESNWLDELLDTLEAIIDGGCNMAIVTLMRFKCVDIVSDSFLQVEGRLEMLIKSLCREKK
jgi:hypothetical protein